MLPPCATWRRAYICRREGRLKLLHGFAQPAALWKPQPTSAYHLRLGKALSRSIEDRELGMFAQPTALWKPQPTSAYRPRLRTALSRSIADRELGMFAQPAALWKPQATSAYRHRSLATALSRPSL